jgi:hypothetical protein
MSSGRRCGPTDCMTVFAHIGGVPVEEALLSAAPVLFVTGGCWLSALRSRLERRARG